MLLGIRLVNKALDYLCHFTGYDIWRFGGDATPALYARWISLGALSPFAELISLQHQIFRTFWSVAKRCRRHRQKLHQRALPTLALSV